MKGKPSPSPALPRRCRAPRRRCPFLQACWRAEPLAGAAAPFPVPVPVTIRDSGRSVWHGRDAFHLALGTALSGPRRRARLESWDWSNRDPPAPSRPKAECASASLRMASADSSAPPSLPETTAAPVSALPADPLKSKLQALKAKQEEMRQRKKELRKAMKNAARRVSRLEKRARLLSNEDLVRAVAYASDWIGKHHRRKRRLQLVIWQQRPTVS